MNDINFCFALPMKKIEYHACLVFFYNQRFQLLKLIVLILSWNMYMGMRNVNGSEIDYLNERTL